MSDQLLIRNCKLFNAIEQDEFVDILIESGSIVQIWIKRNKKINSSPGGITC